MAALSLDNEFMQYWLKLTPLEKESLLSVAKNYIYSKNESGIMDIKQYNRQIEEAEKEFENGDYISGDDMLKQLKQWQKKLPDSFDKTFTTANTPLKMQ